MYLPTVTFNGAASLRTSAQVSDDGVWTVSFLSELEPTFTLLLAGLGTSL